MFPETLIKFVEELLKLFENKNAIIYRRLIRLRHRIKNVIDPRELDRIAIEWLASDGTADKLKRRDSGLLKGTEFEIDCEWTWSELTLGNRATIWKWIDRLVTEIESNR